MAPGFFAILDDLAALMDDVALATKVATRKTAGILGDDLAVNAEKATGFLAERELPILWSITKSSLINKLIIVPVALLLNAFFPVAIIFILLVGGCYLAYEGVEKIIDYFVKATKKEPPVKAGAKLNNPASSQEVEKIKSAVTTDFILSVQIVIIALGTVIGQSLTVQIMTVSAVGTFALLLVAGGIFVHNIPYLHRLLPGLPDTVKEFGVGLVVGLAVVGIFALFRTLRRSPTMSNSD